MYCYAFKFEFNQGSFQGRTWDPEQLHLGEFVTIDLAPGKEGTLPCFLTKAGKGNFYLEFRSRDQSPATMQWLSTPQSTYSVSWIPGDLPEEKFYRAIRPDLFDGLIFFEQTRTPKPSQHVLSLMPKKKGL